MRDFRVALLAVQRVNHSTFFNTPKLSCVKSESLHHLFANIGSNELRHLRVCVILQVLFFPHDNIGSQMRKCKCVKYNNVKWQFHIAMKFQLGKTCNETYDTNYGI